MYFLHLKKENGSPILLEEWQRLINIDSEIQFSNTTIYASPSGELVTKSGGFYGIWTPSGTNLQIYFWLEDGEIKAIYDQLTLNKMHELSKRVDGVVSGDMGEEL